MEADHQENAQEVRDVGGQGEVVGEDEALLSLQDFRKHAQWKGDANPDEKTIRMVRNSLASGGTDVKQVDQGPENGSRRRLPAPRGRKITMELSTRLSSFQSARTEVQQPAFARRTRIRSRGECQPKDGPQERPEPKFLRVETLV